jgi:ketosteroid isomerase-like protein
MSTENVEAFQRYAVDAINRRDVEALLEGVDPEVEWHPGVLVPLEGGATVYRGYEGVREMMGDLFASFAEFDVQYSEFRDLGDTIVAVGRVRTRGAESGAVTESPFAAVTDFRTARRFGFAPTSTATRPSKPPRCRSSCAVTPQPRSPAERVPLVYLWMGGGRGSRASAGQAEHPGD